MSGWVRSPAQGRASTPRAANSRTRSATPTAFMSHATMRAPARPNARATAFPICPARPTPVTSATFPLKSYVAEFTERRGRAVPPALPRAARAIRAAPPARRGHRAPRPARGPRASRCRRSGAARAGRRCRSAGRGARGRGSDAGSRRASSPSRLSRSRNDRVPALLDVRDRHQAAHRVHQVRDLAERSAASCPRRRAAPGR